MKAIKLLILIFFTALSSSAQIGRELYRPVFHYSPAYNWMNDPNGLVYYNGKYHMFYQCNPSGLQPAENKSWGHAVSSDMINWDEKPIAIPVKDGVMAYSGSVVVDWNNTSGFGINGKPPLVAIYTGKTSIEDQRIAYSNDEGLTWTNYSQNPVLTMNNNQFRDPKVVWHQESQKWIMVVSISAYQGIRFYSSSNLKNWTLLPGFGSAGNQSGFWECPDLFKLPVDNDTNKTKWVLMHSIAPTAQYFIGDFDGNHFSWVNTAPNGIIIDDFESNGYNNWTITGTAFGNAPSAGSSTLCGLGSGFVKSTFDGNGSQGKLLSSDFIIQKKYIGFLIGGGNYQKGAYIKLVVNNQPVRSSTGLNEDLLKWRNWDVSPLIGQTAHIEIVDSVTGRWGHINIDHIIQSDVLNDHVNMGQVDYGKDFYGLQSFSDVPNGRRIWLAWLNSWNYATNIPTNPWKGIMSLPREVKLETHNGKLKVVQKPVEELKSLRKDVLSFRNTNLNDINNSLRNGVNNSLYNPTFKQFELKAKIAVGNKAGFSLKFKKIGLRYSEFIFDFINKEIRFDRSKNSAGLSGDQNFTDIQVAPLLIEDGFIDLHLFVDNCSAELFTAGGQVVMSNQIFPDSVGNKVELTSLNEDFVFDEFDIWKMDKNALLPTSYVVKDPMFYFYPNPIATGNGLTIKIRDAVAGQTIFRIFNSSGILISEFQPASNSLILPGNKLPSSNGLYFITASDGMTTQTEKLVVLGR